MPFDTRASTAFIVAALLCTAACANDNSESPNTSNNPNSSNTSDNSTSGEENKTSGENADKGDNAKSNSNPDNTTTVVTTCAGEPPSMPAPGELCAVTPGSGDHIILFGDVIGADEVHEGGAVIVEAGSNAKIVYAGCDWASRAEAADATVVSCPDGVISPALLNAHDHITYNADNGPKGHGDTRFNHRHDWRRGIRGFPEVDYAGSNSDSKAVLYGELRHLMAGTTSMAGSGAADGFVRNLDRSSATEGLVGADVNYETFPLGDSSGKLLTQGCDYGRMVDEGALSDEIFLPHVAEGIDAEARNEFVCLSGGAVDVIADNTSIIHGIGLRADDIARMALVGAQLVWSPRTNIDLYGQTADVLTYKRLGVTVALGTDWIVSGSMNMLRELACVDFLNKTYYNRELSDAYIFDLATINAAIALGVDDEIGSLEGGQGRRHRHLRQERGRSHPLSHHLWRQRRHARDARGRRTLRRGLSHRRPRLGRIWV